MEQVKVKDWLREHNRTRAWLAEKCDVAVQTVNNWLSTERGVPSKAALIIQSLMDADILRASQNETVFQRIVLEFDEETFDLINDAATKKKQRIRDWAEDGLKELAYRDLRETASLIQEMVAEPQATYKKAAHKKTDD